MNDTPLGPPTADPADPTGGTDAHLVDRYRSGEDAAAADLYRRYARRLRALARKRCPADFAARFDADDVVQSVFRVFFQGVRRDAYEVPPGGEIWGLLMVLALNKIRNLVGHHRAGKRAVARTAAAAGADPARVLGRDESAAQFLRLVLDEELADLPESNRAMVRLRLEGYEIGEIADRTGRSRRTVERALQDFRAKLLQP